MKYAHIQNDTVIDVFTTQQGFSIEESLHPSLIDVYNTVVPDEVGAGWTRNTDGTFSAPIPPTIPVASV